MLKAKIKMVFLIAMVLALASALASPALPAFKSQAAPPARAPSKNSKDPVKDLETWRKYREEKIKEPYGWLSQIGLVNLKEGKVTIGSADDAAIKLPAGAPARAGFFEVRGEHVALVADPSTDIHVNGKKIKRKFAVKWKFPKYSQIEIGRFHLIVVEREIGTGARVRIRDPEAQRRKDFKGMQWFPPNPDYRVIGKFKAASQKNKLRVMNSQGTENEVDQVGIVEFTIKEKPQKLLAFSGGDNGQLFLVFKDATSGKTTYPPGRFLETLPPEPDGTVLIDFNYAYQPPCAFTHFATCPYPPKENILEIAIEAGELLQKK